MMKLFCDVTPLTGNLAGIGVYTKNLLQGIHRLDPGIEFHCGIRSLNWKLIREFHMDYQNIYGFPVKIHHKLIPGRLTGKPGTTLSRLLNFKASDYDLIHMTASLCPIWMNFDSYRKAIFTVHDMYTFHHDLPLNHSWYEEEIRKKLPAQLQECAAVITVSEYSKKEIIHFTGIPAEKIHVIPNSVQWDPSDHYWENSSILQQYQLENIPFFLSVSTLRPHKNYANLIRGFRKFCQSPDYHGERLLIVGIRQPDDAEVYDLIQSTPGVLHLSGIPAPDLKMLYHRAKGFFLISFMEGFGIPLLEAMTCGTPCCYSSGTSLQEIGRDAAFSVSPADIDAIADQFAVFAEGGNAIKESVEKCRQIATEYTIDSVARKTLSLYHQVIREQQ